MHCQRTRPIALLLLFSGASALVYQIAWLRELRLVFGASSAAALSFGAVTYVIPFLFIIYPGMLAQAGFEGFCRAAFSGILFVLAFANLFGGLKISGNRVLDILFCLVIAVMAVLPGLWTSMVALALTIGLYAIRRKLKIKKLTMAV